MTDLLGKLRAIKAQLEIKAPEPLPEQGSRAAEAMAARADSEKYQEWLTNRQTAKNELATMLPQLIGALERNDAGFPKA